MKKLQKSSERPFRSERKTAADGAPERRNRSERPFSRGERTFNREERPTRGVGRPRKNDDNSFTKRERPAGRPAGSFSRSERSTGDSERRFSKSPRPYGNEDKPKRGVGRPRKDDDFPFKRAEKPFNREERPFNREKRTFNSEDRPFSREKRTFNRDERPFNRDERPKRSVGRPRKTDDSSYNRSERPYSDSGRSSDRPKRVFNKTDRPLSREEKPYARRERSFDKSERSFDRSERTYNKSERSFDREERPLRKRRLAPAREFAPKRVQKDPSRKKDDSIRLNKFISNSGICSRREADDYITAGLITVNGEIITQLGSKIKPGDDIRFNGERLKGEEKVYIVMNKPKDFVTTTSDSHADKTVMDLIEGRCPQRVYPVGRLDKGTTGVLLLTNDGELTEKLTHPSYQQKKIYHVFLDKNLKSTDFKQILEGVTLEDGDIHADALSYIEEDQSQLGLEIHSGRNRIVRRIFEHLGYNVKKLDRVYFAGLTKKNLKRGQWRFLTPDEINFIKMGSFD
jgi:23S rRNA pseudouridine2605 synthase